MRATEKHGHQLFEKAFKHALMITDVIQFLLFRSTNDFTALTCNDDDGDFINLRKIGADITMFDWEYFSTGSNSDLEIRYFCLCFKLSQYFSFQKAGKGNKLQKLHHAALSGNEDEVQKLLGKGVGKCFFF